MNEVATIPSLIHEIRGRKVMLDSDLAFLYGVEVKRLNEAVKRNIRRFPSDFIFQLIEIEWKTLRSQIATFKSDSRKYMPYAFTEHGIAMLSSILNSPRAIEVNVAIIRAFIEMRQAIQQGLDFTVEIRELRQTLLLHIENTGTRLDEHDGRINQIIEVLNNLIEHPAPRRRIGFHAGADEPHPPRAGKKN